jgi:hypothetical protein
LIDNKKYSDQCGGVDSVGVIIDVSSPKFARVMWKNLSTNSYPFDDLVLYTRVDAEEERPLLPLFDSSVGLSVEEVHRSLLFGVGEHSKDNILDFLRLHASKDFKFKYKLNRPCSALKAMYAAKEVVALFKDFVEFEANSGFVGSLVFGSTQAVDLSTLMKGLISESISKDHSSLCSKLLATLLSLMCGLLTDFTGTVVVPSFKDLSQQSFETKSNKRMAFKCREECWAPSTDDTTSQAQKQIAPNLKFDKRRVPEAITLLHDCRTMSQTAHKSWKSCVCTFPMEPNSGSNILYIYLVISAYIYLLCYRCV